MTTTIGRASGLRLRSIQRSGDFRRFQGTVIAASHNELRARMQQLEGLPGNVDEPVYPLVSTTDSDLDGFYEIGDVSVAPIGPEGGVAARFELSALRLAGGFARPRIETLATTVLRTNSHGVTTPLGLLGVISNPLDVDATLLNVTPVSITTEDGVVSRYGFTSFAAGTVSWRGFTEPVDYYDGAARVEIQYGSSWYPIHGLHVPLSVSSGWRLSNGFTRVYPTAVGGNGRFTIESYRSGNWVGREFTGYQIDDAGGSTGATTWATGIVGSAGYRPPSIRQNAPEACSVAVYSGKYRTTFHLAAGAGFVQVSIAEDGFAPSTDLLRPGFAPTGGIASTTFAGGLRATADDANALRFLISCPSAVDTVAASGIVNLTTDASSSAWQIAADYEQATYSPTQFRDLFFSATSVRRRVVVR